MMPALSFQNLFAWIVQVCALATLGALLPLLFRIRHPRSQLLYCHAILLLAFLLPVIQPWDRPILITTRTSPAAVESTAAATVPAAAAVSASGEHVILWILAAGIAFKLAWLGAGLCTVRRYRNAATPLYPLPEPVRSALMTTKAGGIFCLSSTVKTPVTFGFAHPVVLLPESFTSLQAAEQRAIACHELLHIRRKDWLVTIFEEVAGALLWFQPAVWWVLGQARLAREQVVDAEVVRLTSEHEPYINALLIMAGEPAGLGLAPAPLFLRKRHLTARMHLLLEEVSMSRLRLTSTYLLMIGILGAAGWLVLASFPLAGQAQVREFKQLSDNITVNPGGDLIQWNISYPADALQKRVEGTVWVELTVRESGQVADARITSGPDELRRTVLQSVLQWRYAADRSPSRTIVVSLDFRLPPPGAPVTLPQPIGARGGLRLPVGGVVRTIDVGALPEASRSDVQSRLRRFEGQRFSEELMQEIRQTLLQVSPDIAVAGAFRLNDDVTITVGQANASPMPPPPPPPPPPPLEGNRVDPAVQNAKLIQQVKPVYPLLARAARVMDEVILDIEVAPDGRVSKVSVLSGHPLLSRAAEDAVRQWVYQPTMAGGQAIAVVTTVKLTFALQNQ